jgi:hypothetical protein
MKRQGILMAIVAGLSLLVLLGVLGIGFSQSGQAEEAPDPTPILQYPDVPPTPTIATQPTNAPSLAGTVLFTDDFSSEDSLADWTFIDLERVLPGTQSVWVIQNGRLVQDRTAEARNPSIRETLAVTGATSWTDYTITAEVYDQENATFGLVARRQGDSFYRYRIIADTYEATPKQVLEKVVDGVATPLVEIDAPGYEQRRWYTVSLRVVGSDIQALLDGNVVAEATDTTLTNGQAGLYTRALGGIIFDDVVVTTP